MKLSTKHTTLLIISITGATLIITRTILDSAFSHSAAFYIAVPFILSMLLALVTDPPEEQTLWKRYLAEMRLSTIIMLATSAFLFEGFICVLFILPIFYLGITIGFLAKYIWEIQKSKRNRNRMNASVLPLLVFVMALEGVAPSTSFERANQVTKSLIIDAPIHALKANMARPIDLPRDRSLYLSIFPLPVDIQAGSLNPGDIHTLDFVYKRWFFTNIDRGEFHLKIEEVGDRHVKTRVVRNTSYFRKYLDIKGTRVAFDPLPDGRTKVSLMVEYDRLLDPAWYFGPLQSLAVNQSADYLLENVICRAYCDGK